MVPRQVDRATRDTLTRLIRTNYRARDEMYAVAEALNDADQQRVCRRLAEYLAGHAAELQQVLLACAEDTVRVEEVPEERHAELFQMIRSREDAAGMLRVAERCERALKEEYDRAVDGVRSRYTKAILLRQRMETRISEQVVRAMLDGSRGPDSER